MLKSARITILLLGLAFSSLIHHKVFADYQPGFCPLTDKRIIAVTGRPMNNYRIIWFELDNESRMPLAVDASAVATEADWSKIMQHVRDGWQWEINRKKWTPKQIQSYKDTFFNLKIKRILE